MQKRRAQGLCFNCNEKFTPGHKCQVSQLLLLESFKLDEEKFLVEHQNDGKAECTAIENVEEIMELEITLHALTGWSAPRTMRIKAAIGSHELVALVDSGSTHNFISERIAGTLSLPVTPTEPFSVRVANGERLTCSWKYNNITANLQGTKFEPEFFSLPLIGLDMVLGVQWLEGLGSVVCDWKKSTMEFVWQ